MTIRSGNVLRRWKRFETKRLFDTIVGEGLVPSLHYGQTMRYGIGKIWSGNVIAELKGIGNMVGLGGDEPLPYHFCREVLWKFGTE